MVLEGQSMVFEGFVININFIVEFFLAEYDKDNIERVRLEDVQL